MGRGMDINVHVYAYSRPVGWEEKGPGAETVAVRIPDTQT